MPRTTDDAKHLLPEELMMIRLAEVEQRLRAFLDRQQIVDLYRCYTRGLNRCDMESLRQVFWPDAQINYGFYSGRRDEWMSTWKENRYMKGLACQAHHITNETVDIEGDVAHVESYLISFWRPPSDEDPALILGGRYIDRLDRRCGEWRIAVREFIPHFWTETKSIFQATFTQASWPHSACGLGAGDKSDPCYRRPLHPRMNSSDGDGK